MYLMGFVTSASLETQRPTGNVELVDLSLKYHPPELIPHYSSNGHRDSQTYSNCRHVTTRNGTVCTTSTKTMENSNNFVAASTLKTRPVNSSRPRRTSLEDLPADLYMEPLSPLLLQSPVVQKLPSWVPEETPVNWLKEDLARSTDQSEWWSFCIGDTKQSRSSGKKQTKTFTSTGFESVFADGGISIRVERHPLATTSEEESDTEYSDAASSLARETIAACEKSTDSNDAADDESYARMLQHLQSIEKGSEARKVPFVDARELQPDLKAGVPIAVPSGVSPSLSSPVMEKMVSSSWKKKPKIAKKRMNHGNETAVPMREERELWYNSCVDAEEELSFRLWDEKCANSNDLRNGLKDDEIVKTAQKLSPPNVDALLNLKTFDLHSRRANVGEPDESSEQDYPSPSSFTCGLSPTSLFSDDQEPFCLSVSSSDDNMLPMFHQQFREETRVHRNGFRKSPRSVLSQEPDEISHSTSDGSETTKGNKKLHQWKKPQQTSFSYLYNDESSDLESPMQQGFKQQQQQPFSAFTYSVGKTMGPSSSSSSSDEDEEVTVAGSLQELGIFQEANHLEPWLVNDGGVLDDSEDLEFLLSPDPKCKNVTVKVTSPALRSPQLRNGFSTSMQSHAREEMPKTKHESSPMTKQESPKTKQESPKATHESPKATHESPKTMHDNLRRSTSENKWVPYVTNSLYGYDPHQAVRKRNGGGSQPQNAAFGKPAHGGKASVTNVSTDKAPKRSVNFAADLVKEIPYSTTIPAAAKQQPPRATNANYATAKQQQQQEQTGNKTSKPWETVEPEEGPSILTSRRNRWRRNQDQDQVGDHSDSNINYSRSNSRSSWSFARRERVAQAVPSCAGKLFSWPKKLAFKVHNNTSRRWCVESESEESFVGDRSFGQSSRRDAELVRRILKGSQKKYSNLTEADIMKQDFG